MRPDLGFPRGTVADWATSIPGFMVSDSEPLDSSANVSIEIEGEMVVCIFYLRWREEKRYCEMDCGTGLKFTGRNGLPFGW
jgi:hypothetical protein